MQIFMNVTKDNINELKQTGLNCKSICMINKILQVNQVQLWDFFFKIQDGRQLHGLSKMGLLLQSLADFGDLWVIWYAPEFNGNTLNKCVPWWYILITYCFNPT